MIGGQTILRELRQVCFTQGAGVSGKQSVSNTLRGAQACLAVNQPRDLAREYPLGLGTAFALGVGSLDLRDVRNGQKSKIAQESVDVGIRRTQPELVEGVRRRPFGIQPNRARFGLSKLGAIGFGD